MTPSAAASRPRSPRCSPPWSPRTCAGGGWCDAVKVSSDRERIDLESGCRERVGDTVIVGVQGKSVGASHRSVDAHLVETAAAGRGCREIAGEEGIAGQSELELEVLVREIVVLAFRIPDKVAVDVRVPHALRIGRDFRSTVDRETCHTVTAGRLINRDHGTLTSTAGALRGAFSCRPPTRRWPLVAGGW